MGSERSALTSPRQMRTPKIDHAALEAQIRTQIAHATGAEIATRSQVRLEAMESERERLEAEREEVRVEIVKTEANLAQLNALLDQLRANEADVNIDLGAVLVTIHSLREAGVAMPDRSPRQG